MQEINNLQPIDEILTPTPIDGASIITPSKSSSQNEFNLTLNTTLNDLLQAHNEKLAEDQKLSKGEDVIAYGFRELDPLIKLQKLFINNKIYEYSLAKSIIKVKNENSDPSDATVKAFNKLEVLRMDSDLGADVFKCFKEELAPTLNILEDKNLTKILRKAFELAGQRTVSAHQNLIRRFLSNYTPFIQISAPIKDVHFFYTSPGTLNVKYTCDLHFKHANNQNLKPIPFNISLECHFTFTLEGLVDTKTVYAIEENTPLNQELVKKLIGFKTILESEEIAPENYAVDFIKNLIIEKLSDFVSKKIILYNQNPSDDLSRDELINLFFTLAPFHELDDLKGHVALLASKLFITLNNSNQLHALFDKKFLAGTGAVDFTRNITDNFLNTSTESQQLTIAHIITILNELIKKESNAFAKKRINDFIVFLTTKLCGTISKNDPYLDQLLKMAKEEQISIPALTQIYETADTSQQIKKVIQEVIRNFCLNLDKNISASISESATSNAEGPIDLFYSLAKFHNSIKSAGKKIPSPIENALQTIMMGLISQQQLSALFASKINGTNFIKHSNLIQTSLSKAIPALCKNTQSQNQWHILAKIIIDFTSQLKTTFTTSGKDEVNTVITHIELKLFENLDLQASENNDFLKEYLKSLQNTSFDLKLLDLIYLKICKAENKSALEDAVKLAKRIYRTQINSLKIDIDNLLEANNTAGASNKLIDLFRKDSELKKHAVIVEIAYSAKYFEKINTKIMAAKEKPQALVRIRSFSDAGTYRQTQQVDQANLSETSSQTSSENMFSDTENQSTSHSRTPSISETSSSSGSTRFSDADNGSNTSLSPTPPSRKQSIADTGTSATSASSQSPVQTTLTQKGKLILLTQSYFNMNSTTSSLDQNKLLKLESEFNYYLENRNSTVSYIWSLFTFKQTSWSRLDKAYQACVELSGTNSVSPTPKQSVDTKTAEAKPPVKSTYGCLPCLFKAKKAQPAKHTTITPAPKDVEAEAHKEKKKQASQKISLFTFVRFLCGRSTEEINISSTASATPTSESQAAGIMAPTPGGATSQ